MPPDERHIAGERYVALREAVAAVAAIEAPHPSGPLFNQAWRTAIAAAASAILDLPAFAGGNGATHAIDFNAALDAAWERFSPRQHPAAEVLQWLAGYLAARQGDAAPQQVPQQDADQTGPTVEQWAGHPGLAADLKSQARVARPPAPVSAVVRVAVPEYLIHRFSHVLESRLPGSHEWVIDADDASKSMYLRNTTTGKRTRLTDDQWLELNAP